MGECPTCGCDAGPSGFCGDGNVRDYCAHAETMDPDEPCNQGGDTVTTDDPEPTLSIIVPDPDGDEKTVYASGAEPASEAISRFASWCLGLTHADRVILCNAIVYDSIRVSVGKDRGADREAEEAAQ